MRQEYEGATWAKHGDYWMMHDKQGRAIALMLREAQFRGRKTGEGIPKDERRSAKAI
ncbi:hypothetical protein [Cohnella sp. JJ-181]|uniref:hypothetical protein n=1 Tax=Cohnella rhizoplanae TaxID=2974897 RepID=UPI0022FFBD96|nr:hypothetical protein [Cohnella sp. JJ-181]CAI6073310.1 hypothetical protein COHCIP112018_02380 [Cohnella sp. JJ-181]